MLSEKYRNYVYMVLLIIGLLLESNCGEIELFMKARLSFSIVGSWYVYSKIAAIVCFLALMQLESAKKVLSMKAVVWMNKISFPIFMWHRVLEGSVESFVFLRIYELQEDMRWAVAGAFGATMVQLFLVSLLYHKLFEPIIHKITSDLIERLLTAQRR